MMIENKHRGIWAHTPAILFWGAMWGIFEATVGYFLHMIPFKIGSYIWFPAAYFFMDRVYKATRERRAVIAVALLSAVIKLANLLTPIRPDYVINPAVSIVLESLAMSVMLTFMAERKANHAIGSIAVRVLTVNTLWRLLYTFYAAFLTPAWMREVSVVRDAASYLPFIFNENLISSVVCILAVSIFGWIENKAPHPASPYKHKATQYTLIGTLLFSSVWLQFVF